MRYNEQGRRREGLKRGSPPGRVAAAELVPQTRRDGDPAKGTARVLPHASRSQGCGAKARATSGRRGPGPFKSAERAALPRPRESAGKASASGLDPLRLFPFPEESGRPSQRVKALGAQLRIKLCVFITGSRRIEVIFF